MSLLDRTKGARDRAMEKAKELGQVAKETAKKTVLSSLDAVPDEDLAEFIAAVGAKQTRINAKLEQWGSPARIAAARVQAGPPPSVSFVISVESEE